MRYLLFISVRLGHHTRKTLLKLGKCRNYAFRDENLYFVNVIGSTIISGLGDFLCQSSARAVNSKSEYDARRTIKMAISDGYFGGTFSHFAYESFDIYWPEQSFRSTIKKLAADQIIVAPIGLLIFQITVGYMSAGSFEEIMQDIKDNMLRLYKMHICIWLPTQLVNFYFIPSRYRMMFVLAFSILEAACLSRIMFEIVR